MYKDVYEYVSEHLYSLLQEPQKGAVTLIKNICSTPSRLLLGNTPNSCLDKR